ncbi:hypothetical protein [Paenibacillus donghaensis]|nr:hypothetical protein [Paenibacillus donghaensis]
MKINHKYMKFVGMGLSMIVLLTVSVASWTFLHGEDVPADMM